MIAFFIAVLSILSLWLILGGIVYYIFTTPLQSSVEPVDRQFHSHSVNHLSFAVIPSIPRTYRSRLDRSKLLDLIEHNNGAQGLDLSGYDLSSIDLGREAISQMVKERVGDADEIPLWYDPRTGGIDLRGANLSNSSFRNANISFARLDKCLCLASDFQFAFLQRATLRDANCAYADFSGSDLSGALAVRTSFQEVDLSFTDLTAVDLSQASLKGASLHQCILSNTKLGRDEIGNGVIQESSKELLQFLARHDPKRTKDFTFVKQLMDGGYLLDAQRVYANLRANWLGNGNFDDAGWAHMKERRINRQTHRPDVAAKCYAHKMNPNAQFSVLRLFAFYINHCIKWFLSWLADLSCGYGERPLRVAGFSLAIIVGFVPIYVWSEGLTKEGGALSNLDYISYSLGTFTTLGFSSFQATTSLAQILSSIEAFLGISMLALLMFTLGNRISRS